MNCPQHPFLQLSHGCTKLDCPESLLCAECLIRNIDHSNKHQQYVQPIQKFLNTCMDEINVIKKKIQPYDDFNQNKKHSIGIFQKNIKNQKDSIQAEIDQTLLNIKSILDEKKQSLFQFLDDMDKNFQIQFDLIELNLLQENMNQILIINSSEQLTEKVKENPAKAIQFLKQLKFNIYDKQDPLSEYFKNIDDLIQNIKQNEKQNQAKQFRLQDKIQQQLQDFKIIIEESFNDYQLQFNENQVTIELEHKSNFSFRNYESLQSQQEFLLNDNQFLDLTPIKKQEKPHNLTPQRRQLNEIDQFPTYKNFLHSQSQFFNSENYHLQNVSEINQKIVLLLPLNDQILVAINQKNQILTLDIQDKLEISSFQLNQPSTCIQKLNYNYIAVGTIKSILIFQIDKKIQLVHEITNLNKINQILAYNDNLILFSDNMGIINYFDCQQNMNFQSQIIDKIYNIMFLNNKNTLVISSQNELLFFSINENKFKEEKRIQVQARQLINVCDFAVLTIGQYISLIDGENYELLYQKQNDLLIQDILVVEPIDEGNAHPLFFAFNNENIHILNSQTLNIIQTFKINTQDLRENSIAIIPQNDQKGVIIAYIQNLTDQNQIKLIHIYNI